jgi:uncharacterized protein (UPF0332 family)
MYDSCVADGFFRTLETINKEKVKSLMENASINLSTAEIVTKSINKNAKEWLNVFTLHYEALRIYTEALLLFEKIQSNNHQCLFSALCMKFPDLELDWDFFDNVRTKRNGVNYYGEQVTFKDWKSVEIQVRLYLSILRKELEKKLN